MPNPLSFWTADQFGSVIGQFTALIAALTALVVAMTALYKLGGLRRASNEAVMKADSAVKSADNANDRASNNAQAINTVRQTLDQVTLSSPAIPTSPIEPVRYPSSGGSGG